MTATSGRPRRPAHHTPRHDAKAPRAAARDTRETDDRMLFGIHAVAAALDNPARRVRRLLATENAERRLAEQIAARKLAVERVRPKDLDRLLGADTVHQGIAIEADPLPEPELADLIARAGATESGPLIVLDQVTDPHNVGAILRSAAVFGAAGLLTTRRHSPPLNGTLAKSASGALELVPVCLVQNLSRAIDELKSAGVRVIGLDGEGETLLEDAPFNGPVALVLGAEGKGLRQLTRESCHHLCRIGTSNLLASLNVSNAAAISLHLAAMRRRQTS
ncbi:MAG: 23S rRNA (guanosine(2251)-2'-O)-methyltransferase RlmB [Hyphomicrobiaceae bacterium]|nr:23S rRNA (guanosine(2251)-2'-O)-methyltransferase RlmB [Hyphomicrobiaceae bacterium]MCC0008171.1 23S rRNA (guanosine(2251)-2'-O)-methyltransferase RlmB [Hyphomicrobiaceae bacterium]